ncbi:MAG: transcriptional repressor [Clostridiales bacterium]|nr:transcriptional repressor [Clostridiales bacterium]
MTKYARKILEIVNESNEHLTAEQIFMKMKEAFPKVVLATVYNNLNAMCENGLIRRVVMENAADRFDKTLRHDHLICRQCGKISDLYLQDITSILEKQTGIVIDSYDLKLMYLCDECREKQ